MFPIVNNANAFLFGSTLLILVCSSVKVDKYESNSLFNLDNYSKMIMSSESVNLAEIKRNGTLRYWHQGNVYENKILSVSKLENSQYEIILSNSQSFPSISWISYKIGKGSVWSEVFKSNA